MSLDATSENTTPPAVRGQPGKRSRFSTLIRRVRAALPTVARLLMGLMLMLGGWTWIHRADPGAYLAGALSNVLEKGGTVGFYAPFLRSVVIPNASLFAFLVGWGEFLSGTSLLLGAASRLAAAVAAFQLINYGLMGGWTSLAFHGVFVGFLAASVYWQSGRILGVDRWLHRRWPNARIW